MPGMQYCGHHASRAGDEFQRVCRSMTAAEEEAAAGARCGEEGLPINRSQRIIHARATWVCVCTLQLAVAGWLTLTEICGAGAARCSGCGLAVTALRDKVLQGGSALHEFEPLRARCCAAPECAAIAIIPAGRAMYWKCAECPALIGDEQMVAEDGERKLEKLRAALEVCALTPAEFEVAEARIMEKVHEEDERARAFVERMTRDRAAAVRLGLPVFGVHDNEAARALFSQFDVNGNGYIGAEEVQALAEVLLPDVPWDDALWPPMCAEYGCSPAEGFDYPAFLAFKKDAESEGASPGVADGSAATSRNAAVSSDPAPQSTQIRRLKKDVVNAHDTEAARALFSQHDTNSNGYIGAEEVQALAAALLPDAPWDDALWPPMCAEYGCSPAEGFDYPAFLAFKADAEASKTVHAGEPGSGKGPEPEPEPEPE
jgi:Ca2+-binding EF-hand superfamily protein